MSHKFTQRIHTHEARHLPHAGTVTGGLLAAYTQNPHALRAQLSMRADRDITQIREVPGLDQQSAQPQHIQCLRNGLRHARCLDHHVSAAALRQAAHKFQARLQSRFAHIQDMISTQSLRKLQPVIRKICCNNVPRSEHPGFHEKAHAERSDAQNHHGVIELECLARKHRHLLGTVESHRDGHDLGEYGNFGGQIVRHPH